MKCGICVVFLVQSGYKKNFIQQPVDRARQTPRDEALRYRPKKENSRIPFTVTYHPGLPDIEGMLRKLHPVLHSPQRFRDAIKEVPIVAFSQIYINIKKNSFLMVLFFYTTYIYICLDLQTHGYRNLSYIPSD